MIRTGYGKHGKDSMFYANVMGAKRAGLLIGAYHYSYALTPEDAKIEAESCRDIINYTGQLFELPIFFDLEDADSWKINHGFDFSKENINAICETFVNSLCLNCGIYASYSWLTDYIDTERLNVPIWNAQWSNQNDFPNSFLWQYTDREQIGDYLFDANVLYQ